MYGMFEKNFLNIEKQRRRKRFVKKLIVKEEILIKRRITKCKSLLLKPLYFT